MTVLLPTAYLPPISYISGCLHDETILIDGFETYPKQTLRNRAGIYGPNGFQLITVPVNRVNGNHTMTRDLLIANTTWKRLHWRSIETAYNNSPFFLYYRDEIEEAYVDHFDYLLDFNTRLLEIIFRILKLKRNISFTQKFREIPPGTTDRSFSGRKKLLPAKTSPYNQVFAEKHGFIPDLSIIDLIFNLGPESIGFLNSGKNPTFAML